MFSIKKTISSESVYHFFVAVLVLGFMFVWNAFPTNPMPYAGHDDALFMRGAESILSGHWLGPYDNRTLVKGPLLSIIAAIGASAGIWAKTIEGAIYAVMLLLCAYCTRRLGVAKPLVLVIILLLAANPHLWSIMAGRRFLRDVLYASLAMILFQLVLAAVSRQMKWRSLVLIWISIGFIMGAMYLTREEDIWMLATTVAILGLAVMRAVLLIGLKAVARRRMEIGLGCVSAAIGIAVFVTPVLLLNYNNYGRAIISEFRAPEFRAAVGALMRVGDKHPSGYVPVSQASMNAVFTKVSEATPIRDHWPAISSDWSKYGANLLSGEVGEVAGGWFVWALRDTVAAAGHHSSAQTARQFYERLAAGVNDACDQGLLTCRSPRDTLAPELEMGRIPYFLRAMIDSIHYVITLSSPPIVAPRGSGDNNQLERWARLIGPVVKSSENEFVVSGWIAHKFSEPILLPDYNAQLAVYEMQFSRNTEVVSVLGGQGIQMARAVRFRLAAACQAPGCSFFVTTNGGDKQSIVLDTSVPGPLQLEPPFMGFIDVFDHYASPSVSVYPLEKIRIAISSMLVAGAQLMVPVLCGTSILGVLIFPFIWRREQRSEWLYLCTVGAAVAVIGRCAIIAYIHVTSWHAISVGYLGLTYPFVILYAVAGSIIFVRILCNQVVSIRSSKNSLK